MKKPFFIRRVCRKIETELTSSLITKYASSKLISSDLLEGDDATKETASVMYKPKPNIKVKRFCNLAGLSFILEEIATSIKKHKLVFKICCKPDFYKPIADSWPQSTNDNAAREIWGCKRTISLNKLTGMML